MLKDKCLKTEGPFSLPLSYRTPDSLSGRILDSSLMEISKTIEVISSVFLLNFRGDNPRFSQELNRTIQVGLNLSDRYFAYKASLAFHEATDFPC